MEKLQWFKFSISEWKMGKIQRCNAETKSMFLELCCLYWINETKVSIEDAIIECDKEHYDILISKRIIKEVDGFIKIYFLDEQFESAMEKSVKARESVEKRWAKRKGKELPTNNKRNTNVIQPNYERNTEENRIEENRIENSLSTKVESDFDFWWNLYDKKTGKETCLKKWNKLKNEEQKKCLEVVERYVQSTPDKQYRKNPSTYLNGKHWNDEIEVNSQSHIPITPQYERRPIGTTKSMFE